MAVFEEIPASETYIDDSIPLFCTFTNSRIVDGHTEYIIKVKRGFKDDNTWTIYKRYSEFDVLHREIEASHFDINLPPKKYVGNLNRKFILERQRLLQRYMNRVLDQVVLSTSIHVKKFLDPDNYDLTWQDSVFQHASMALRGKTDFHNIKPLPNIGWRFRKVHCSVKKLNESRREYILTWISKNGIISCLEEKELQCAFKVLLELSHPYIVPIVTGNCYLSGTLIIRSSCPKGSLRELIYSRSPFDTFLHKCRYRSLKNVMDSPYVSTISIQVLNALNFLHKKGIPYGNLHTGNVFFEDDVAKITDVENGIFGLPSFYKRYLVENRKIHSIEDVDVYCFGHLLYEMAFGERLQRCFWEPDSSECHENIRPVLELILSNSPENKLPSVSALLSSNAFSAGSPKMEFENKPRCRLNSHSRELLYRCKQSIEEKLHKEQNELRKHRRLTLLQEKMEAEEKHECTIRVKEKRKSQKKSSEPCLKSSYTNNFENISNASTPTSVSTDSSSQNSGCDKSNETQSDTKPMADLSGTSPSISETDNRSAFLQSIVNFNKTKLKKTSSNPTS